MSRIKPVSSVTLDAQVPLLIIGAGAAGLCAALAAKEAGAEPLVIERDAVPAGSTSLSAGLIPAAGTRFQRARGIADSPQLFAADIQRKAKKRSGCGRRRCGRTGCRATDRMAGRSSRPAVRCDRQFQLPRPFRLAHARLAHAHGIGVDQPAAQRGRIQRHFHCLRASGRNAPDRASWPGLRRGNPSRRRRPRAHRLRGADPGLQRLRRQSRSCPKLYPGDGKRPLFRPSGKSRRCHPVG